MIDGSGIESNRVSLHHSNVRQIRELRSLGTLHRLAAAAGHDHLKPLLIAFILCFTLGSNGEVIYARPVWHPREDPRTLVNVSTFGMPRGEAELHGARPRVLPAGR